MSYRPIFKGKITDDGRFLMERGEQEKMYKHMLALHSGPAYFTIQKRQPVRSLNQNAYFHGVIVKIISDDTGQDFDDVKEYLKHRFLPPNVKTMFGEKVELERHTATLDTIAFENFCEKCRAWAVTELNIKIPLPNEIELDLE